MKLTKISPLTHVENTMDLPLSEEEFTRAQRERQSGALIQQAFPTLNAEQREFVLTGYTQEDWNEMFKSGEES